MHCEPWTHCNNDSLIGSVSFKMWFPSSPYNYLKVTLERESNCIQITIWLTIVLAILWPRDSGQLNHVKDLYFINKSTDTVTLFMVVTHTFYFHYLDLLTLTNSLLGFFLTLWKENELITHNSNYIMFRQHLFSTLNWTIAFLAVIFILS